MHTLIAEDLTLGKEAFISKKRRSKGREYRTKIRYPKAKV